MVMVIWELQAGHFVKMVHNGIEYGMMQAIGEGFELMENHRLISIMNCYQRFGIMVPLLNLILWVIPMKHLRKMLN